MPHDYMKVLNDLEERADRMNEQLIERAQEIAAFLGKPEQECINRLSQGFGAQHKRVNDDFRRANPKTDEELLAWYRNTEEYIWELTAYHLDPGFNYSGMCRGIAERLKNEGVKSVLCLGDGVGDLTLTLCKAGMNALYHDLHDSKTFKFALNRFRKHGQLVSWIATSGWSADIYMEDMALDAVVSLDFLEHVTNVEEWVREIHKALKPGGIFVAQNAFGIGSGPDGSIPMHLAANDRFEKDWDPLLFRLGFTQLGPQWYRKA